MRLVTFTVGSSPARTGALIDADRKVLDLQAAYGRVYHATSPLLESMLHIIEAGDAALDTISQLLQAPPGPSAFNRDEVRLLAPVPVPPQCATSCASSSTCARPSRRWGSCAARRRASR